MKRTLTIVAMLITFSIAALGQAMPAPAPVPAPTPAPTPRPSKFKVGDMAPDFTLTDTKGVKVKLSDFRGKSNVVLAFYVFAFTGG